MATHNDLGNTGEEMATAYLIDKGYKIIERNYRFDKAEIDILALFGDTLAVVEVKTRSSTEFGNPQDFVNNKKIKLLVKAVDEYVKANMLDVEVRFDIIGIVKQEGRHRIEHLKDAFYHF